MEANNGSEKPPPSSHQIPDNPGYRFPRRTWASRLRWWWHRKLNIPFGNIFRWMMLLAFFIFCFSMTVGLYEILAFQQRVIHLAGDAEMGRRVLTVLHRLHGSDQLQPEKTSLPFGAMAVSLDRLNEQALLLDKFSLNSEEVSNKQPINQFENQNSQTELRGKEQKEKGEDIINKITLNMSEFKKLLENNTPGMKIVQSFTEIEMLVESLQSFSIENQEPTVASQQSSQDGNHPQSDRLVDGTREGNNSLKGVDAAAALQHDLESLKIATEKTRTALINPEITPPQTRAIYKYLGQISSQAHALQKNTVLVGLSKEQSVVKSNTQPYDPNQYKTVLKESLKRIESVLIDYSSEMITAKNLAKEMTELGNAAEALGTLNVEVKEFDTGESLEEGPNAIARFEKNVSTIRDNVAELSRILSENTPVVAVAAAFDATQPEAQPRAKAQTILDDFDALSRFEPVLLPFSFFKGTLLERPLDVIGLMDLGFSPQRLATLNRDSLTLMFVFVIGAIGSLLYITKDQLWMAWQGRRLGDRAPRPIVYFIFRPIFGVVMALAVYLLVKAGQFALSGAGENVSDLELNLPIFSVVALFAGLLSWDAFDAIENKGSAWFSSQQRRNLWATGLANALRHESKTETECAYQIGRSQEQMQRWILFRDQVTPEIQDRIATWLGRPVRELFGENLPRDAAHQQPLWGTGLKDALEDKNWTARDLADLLGEEDPGRVQDWVELRKSIMPATQWRLVDVLDWSHAELFDPQPHNKDLWATALRQAMRRRDRDAAWLAIMLKRHVQQVRGWMELDSPVPQAVQVRIADQLDFSPGYLFSPVRPKDEAFRWAINLKSALEQHQKTSEGLAEALDVDLTRVQAWLDMKKKVAPETQKQMASWLDVSASDIFAGAKAEANGE